MEEKLEKNESSFVQQFIEDLDSFNFDVDILDPLGGSKQKNSNEEFFSDDYFDLNISSNNSSEASESPETDFSEYLNIQTDKFLLFENQNQQQQQQFQIPNVNFFEPSISTSNQNSNSTMMKFVTRKIGKNRRPKLKPKKWDDMLSKWTFRKMKK